MVSALLHRSTSMNSSSGVSQPEANISSTGASAVTNAINNNRNINNISTESTKQRLLICAPSNTAVDELLMRLSMGVLNNQGELRSARIVRLGEPLEGASTLINKLTLEAQIEERLLTDATFIKLQAAKENIRRLEKEEKELDAIAATAGGGAGAGGAGSSSNASGISGRRDGDRSTSSNFYNANAHNNELQSKEPPQQKQRSKEIQGELFTQRQVKISAEMNLERVRTALRQEILYEADIVGATLSGSGRKQFLDLVLRNDVVFDTAIIDEAAQTTEPSCLIPLRLGCRRLVLVGDPRQLPATVLCKAASNAGLGRSLFERLERAEHEVVMLTIQYRMHPGE